MYDTATYIGLACTCNILISLEKSRSPGRQDPVATFLINEVLVEVRMRRNPISYLESLLVRLRGDRPVECINHPIIQSVDTILFHIGSCKELSIPYGEHQPLELFSRCSNSFENSLRILKNLSGFMSMVLFRDTELKSVEHQLQSRLVFG